MNEPDDRTVADDCDDWQILAEKAARAVRTIDPARTLIVEPNQGGSAEGFDNFRPLPLTGVVYSFHMYAPFTYTHQGVDQPADPVVYPGVIEGKTWNKDALREALAPANAFARRYRVHMYVGEFSALRWAPGADRYLADLTELFEAEGWDWSYHAFREWHGWNLELPAQRDEQTVLPKTPRLDVLRGWMRKNERLQ